MRILVHDYAGHPFQVQLSRALAMRDHEVTHLFSESIQTPKGLLSKRPDDPATFDPRGIPLTQPFAKYRYFKRYKQEREYGRYLKREVERVRPEVALSSNTPLDPQAALLRACRRHGARFVFWLQDIHSTAISDLLRSKLPVLGAGIGRYYSWIERSLLRRSDEIIVITEDFLSTLRRWGIPEEQLHVIHNWAPVDDVPTLPKNNVWARAYGLEKTFNLVYSGTLGLKHNPDLLLQLAHHFKEDPGVRVVVVSEGLGAQWLENQRRLQNLDNLLIIGFQPFETLPQVLASADILVAILEPDAGSYSVPSKVLTYLCAKRPLLLAVPTENLAARLVEQQQAGLTVDPNDTQAFIGAADRLFTCASFRSKLGDNGRAYAEAEFAIDLLAERFEQILAY